MRIPWLVLCPVLALWVGCSRQESPKPDAAGAPQPARVEPGTGRDGGPISQPSSTPSPAVATARPEPARPASNPAGTTPESSASVPAPATVPAGSQASAPAAAPVAAPPRSPSSTDRLLGAVRDAAVSLATNRTDAAKPASASTPTGGSVTGQSLAGLAGALLSSDQAVQGLKEALAKGIDHAVASLGKPNGFLANPKVKIPMPPQLQTVEKTLRTLKQDRMADEFIATMNRAAEQAVPAGVSVFADAVRQMTIQDAQAILAGPEDAATQYFRRTAGGQLAEKFQPIVKEATSQAGVTAAYKQLTDKASFANAFLDLSTLDVDRYITTKAADGVFQLIAEEEKRIRENPAARTTDLLKRVFGAAKK